MLSLGEMLKQAEGSERRAIDIEHFTSRLKKAENHPERELVVKELCWAWNHVCMNIGLSEYVLNPAKGYIDEYVALNEVLDKVSNDKYSRRKIEDSQFMSKELKLQFKKIDTRINIKPIFGATATTQNKIIHFCDAIVCVQNLVTMPDNQSYVRFSKVMRKLLQTFMIQGDTMYYDIAQIDAYSPDVYTAYLEMVTQSCLDRQVYDCTPVLIRQDIWYAIQLYTAGVPITMQESNMITNLIQQCENSEV